jgi:uncharacterized protein (TIGR02231 family)
MRTIIACICFILVASNLKAENKTTLNSKIKNVTVFLNGAQISREAAVTVNKGIYEFVFDSLPMSINQNSLQVSGKGEFIILDTKYLVTQPDYNTKPILPEHITKLLNQLNDSIEMVNYQLEELRNNKQVLETEKQFLITNKTITTDSLPVLKDAFVFFREKYNDINNKLLQTKKNEAKQQKRLTNLNESLAKLNQEIALKYHSKPLQPNHKVIVTVKSNQQSNGKLILNYMIANASWSPSYDLRANQITEPVELTYKAMIYQNSGENWDDVKLKLSTNNPYKSKTKPVLPVWYLNYYNNYTRVQTATYGGLAQPSMDYDKNMTEKKMELADSESAAYYTTMTESFTNVEFNISIPYTIPSDGEQHTVAVKEEKLKVEYNYFMVPKMDNNAFLVANIKGFEELNLLPASANIYFDGTYIGQTMINPAVTGDSLAIDMGREERITVKRTALKIEEKDKLLGSDKIKNYGFEMNIRNNLASTISLIVEDQIPVSNDKEIVVTLKNKDNATLNENTGMLVWKFNLASKETKKLNYNYEIKHPKDKQLALR